MQIKASGIANLTDARYFAARDVQFLGFNLEAGTPGYLDPIYMRAIREWVEGPVIVGEFGRTPLEHVRAAAEFYGLQAVEVETPADSLALLSGLTVLLDVSSLIADPAALERVMAATAGQVSFFMLRFAAKNVAWQAPRWPALCAEYPVLVELDLPAAAWPAALEWLKPAGISLRGGAEEKVGMKSFDEIEAIFDALEL